MSDLPAGVKWRFVVMAKENGDVSGEVESEELVSTYELARHLTMVASIYFRAKPVLVNGKTEEEERKAREGG